MTRDEMVQLLGSAYARVWAIKARASGTTEANPALAEVAGAAAADIAAVKAALAASPASPPDADALADATLALLRVVDVQAIPDDHVPLYE